MPKISAALVLAGLAIAGAAHAQVSGRGGVMVSPPSSACAADIRALCANIPHVRGAVRQCLAVHHDHVSSSCRIALSQVSAPHQMLMGGHH